MYTLGEVRVILSYIAVSGLEGALVTLAPESFVAGAVMFQPAWPAAFDLDPLTKLEAEAVADVLLTGKYSSCTVPPEMVHLLQSLLKMHCVVVLGEHVGLGSV